MFNLPSEIQSKINQELKRGEVVKWAGQPNLEKFLGKAMAGRFLIWLFFIPWTVFSVFWIAGAAGFKIPDFSQPSFELFFPLFGVPFLLIGIFGLASPFFLPFFLKKKAASMVYLITNLRAVIIQGTKTTTYKSYYPKQLTNLERTENPDGSGTIIFVKDDGETNIQNKKFKGEGFWAIENVKKVASLLEDLANSTSD